MTVVLCPICNGIGYIGRTFSVRCETCNGTGEVGRDERTGLLEREDNTEENPE